jgi:hypothetical protein
MKFICFDIEAGGAGLNYSILTLCFKIVTFDKTGFQIIDTLHLVIKHDVYKVCPEGLAINQLDLAWVTANGISISEAGKMLFRFLEKHGSKELLIPLGHGVSGDILQITNPLYKEDRIMGLNVWHRFVSYFAQDTGQIAFLLRSVGKLPVDLALGLKNLCTYFNKTGFNFHTCEGDVDGTIAVYAEELALIG